MTTRLCAAACLGLALTACSSNGARPSPPPRPTSPHLAEARITGVLEISPPFATPYPTRGEVIIDGPVNRRVTVSADGRFTAAVPPGRYRVTGHSPLYGDGRYVCQSVDNRALVVDADATVSTRVTCLEK